MAKRIELKERLANDPKLKIDLGILDNILGTMENDALLESLDMFGVDNFEVDIFLEMGYEFTGVVYVIKGPFRVPHNAKEIILDFLRQVGMPIMIYLKSTLEDQRDVLVAYESSVKLEGLEDLYKELVGEGKAIIKFFIKNDIRDESKDNCDYRLTAREGYRYQANKLFGITSINEDLAEKACSYIVRYLTDFGISENQNISNHLFEIKGEIISTSSNKNYINIEEFSKELLYILIGDRVEKSALNSIGIFAMESKDFISELAEEVFEDTERVNQLEDLIKDFEVENVKILSSTSIDNRSILDFAEITSDKDNWYSPSLVESKRIVVDTVNLNRQEKDGKVFWL